MASIAALFKEEEGFEFCENRYSAVKEGAKYIQCLIDSSVTPMCNNLTHVFSAGTTAGTQSISANSTLFMNLLSQSIVIQSFSMAH